MSLLPDGFTLPRSSSNASRAFPSSVFLATLVSRRSSDQHVASAGKRGDNFAGFSRRVGQKYPREVVPVYLPAACPHAEDLCRFGDSLLPGGKNLLSDASLREILRPQPTPLAGKLRGTPFLGHLGWDYAKRIGDDATGTLVLAKGGGTGFYSANLQILPSERVVIALITSGRANGDKLTEPILTGLLRDRKQIAAEGEPARPPESSDSGRDHALRRILRRGK